MAGKIIFVLIVALTVAGVLVFRTYRYHDLTILNGCQEDCWVSIDDNEPIDKPDQE